METFHPYLPEKALEKYSRITDVLRYFDYVLLDRFRDATTGIDYWFFSQEPLDPGLGVEPESAKD